MARKENIRRLTPARVIIPSRILAREMEARHMSVEDLIALTELPEFAVRGVLTGDMRITQQIADALESAFVIPASFWVNLQNNYDGFGSGI